MGSVPEPTVPAPTKILTHTSQIIHFTFTVPQPGNIKLKLRQQ